MNVVHARLPAPEVSIVVSHSLPVTHKRKHRPPLHGIPDYIGNC